MCDTSTSAVGERAKRRGRDFRSPVKSGRMGYQGWQTCLLQRERLKWWTRARTHMALARASIWLRNACPYFFVTRMAVQRASRGCLSQREHLKPYGRVVCASAGQHVGTTCGWLGHASIYVRHVHKCRRRAGETERQRFSFASEVGENGISRMANLSFATRTSKVVD